MQFREAERGDAANLAALTGQVFLHTYAKRGLRNVLSRYVLAEFTEDRFAAVLDDEQQMVILCEHEAHLVGYVRLAFRSPCPADENLTSEIATLYVQAHFLRRGIGTELLDRALDTFRRRGAAAAWLSVNHENSDALSFYATQGFAPAGSMYFELDGERHENIVLRRALELLDDRGAARAGQP